MRVWIPLCLIVVGCGGKAASGASVGSGGSGSGGLPGGGASGSGGVPEDCGGTVTLRLLGAGLPGVTEFCLGPPGTCAGGSWLEVSDSAGNRLATFPSCSLTSCSSCRATGCPAICAFSSPLPDQGIETTWSGVRWDGGHSCGAGVSCIAPSCAAPGRYVARFCAHELLSGDGGAFDCQENASVTPTCVEETFEYPSSTTVQGVLDLRR